MVTLAGSDLDLPWEKLDRVEELKAASVCEPLTLETGNLRIRSN